MIARDQSFCRKVQTYGYVYLLHTSINVIDVTAPLLIQPDSLLFRQSGGCSAHQAVNPTGNQGLESAAKISRDKSRDSRDEQDNCYCQASSPIADFIS